MKTDRDSEVELVSHSVVDSGLYERPPTGKIDELKFVKTSFDLSPSGRVRTDLPIESSIYFKSGSSVVGSL